MSYFDQSGRGGGGNDFFRGTSIIGAEDQYKFKVRIVSEAFDGGNIVDIMNKVDSLMLLVTPSIIDRQYLTDIKKIDDELAEFRKEAIENYKRKTEDALCPDVVDTPNRIPPLWYFQKKFWRVVMQFELKNLWLRKTRDESL